MKGGGIPFFGFSLLNLIKMQIPLSEKRLGLFYVLIVERQSECAFFRASTSVAALFLLTRKDRKSIETIRVKQL